MPLFLCRKTCQLPALRASINHTSAMSERAPQFPNLLRLPLWKRPRWFPQPPSVRHAEAFWQSSRNALKFVDLRLYACHPQSVNGYRAKSTECQRRARIPFATSADAPMDRKTTRVNS